MIPKELSPELQLDIENSNLSNHIIKWFWNSALSGYKIQLADNCELVQSWKMVMGSLSSSEETLLSEASFNFMPQKVEYTFPEDRNSNLFADKKLMDFIFDGINEKQLEMISLSLSNKAKARKIRESASILAFSIQNSEFKFLKEASTDESHKVFLGCLSPVLLTLIHKGTPSLILFGLRCCLICIHKLLDLSPEFCIENVTIKTFFLLLLNQLIPAFPRQSGVCCALTSVIILKLCDILEPPEKDAKMTFSLQFLEKLLANGEVQTASLDTLVYGISMAILINRIGPLSSIYWHQMYPVIGCITEVNFQTENCLHNPSTVGLATLFLFLANNYSNGAMEFCREEFLVILIRFKMKLNPNMLLPNLDQFPLTKAPNLSKLFFNDTIKAFRAVVGDEYIKSSLQKLQISS